MGHRGDKEGGPEERRRQFEDERGLSDRPELPLEEKEDEDPKADRSDDEKEGEEE
jgi:hypothetical protein